MSGTSHREALVPVADLAEAAANQRGASLIGSGLRLFEGRRSVASLHIGDDAPYSPFLLGRTYELVLSDKDRQAAGAHLTPAHVARKLVAMMPGWSASNTVLDPAVGGAAFLLAAADELVAAGATPAAVLDQLVGVDIDPGAVAVAEAALAIWGLDHGVVPRPLPGMQRGDGLLDELPIVDRVVGNPPFLNQLRSSSAHTAARRAALRERWGELVGAYTDDAWLFLAAGLHSLNDDGVLAMVQPVSVLAARHAHPVRDHVSAQAAVRGLWLARDQVFDAAVQVCGLVIGSGSLRGIDVERRVGANFVAVPALAKQPTASMWGSAAAAALDIPEVHVLAGSSGTVADLATATAGFRDQFYGFVPFVSEAASSHLPESCAKLVTVGMIDVLGLSWGTREFKFAKRSFTRPVIDVQALADADPKLGEWVAARRRPKLIMATQTRVVEVWVDAEGAVIPATPVVSIEPHDQDPDALWLLAAALSAPAMSAYFLAANFGTAMSLNAMKLAARDILAAPLPSDVQAWRQAADVLRESPRELTAFGELMGRAYGAPDADLLRWWLGRIPTHQTP